MEDARAAVDLAGAARALVDAERRVRLLGATQATNAEAERVRLLEALARGGPARPRWTHAPPSPALADLGRGLAALVASLDRLAGDHGEAAALRARAEELDLERRLVEAVGRPPFGALAAQRFPAPEGAAAAAVRAEAEARLALEVPAEAADAARPAVRSDGDEPGSLLSSLRRAVGAARLPFAVVVESRLSALAATSERHVLVAAGRWLSPDDVARTVLHEVEGHVRPRVRAAAVGTPILTAGTARGVDDQEGYALWLEERAGLARATRRRELGSRWLAVDAMRAGADAADVLALLVREHGLPAELAVRTTERIFRGSDGRAPGLGRERVYLEALLRVNEHLAAHPADAALLGSGAVGVAFLDVVRAGRTTPDA